MRKDFKLKLIFLALASIMISACAPGPETQIKSQSENLKVIPFQGSWQFDGEYCHKVGWSGYTCSQIPEPTQCAGIPFVSEISVDTSATAVIEGNQEFVQISEEMILTSEVFPTLSAEVQFNGELNLLKVTFASGCVMQFNAK